MEKRITIILILIFFTVYSLAENVSPSADEEMLELKLKEVHFSITPSFKLVVPDASVKLGLKQKIGDTQLDAETEYNYLYNKINYNIQYSLDFLLTYYVKFYDAINFEQIYFKEKYIQRNKGIILGVHTPALFNYFQIREELKFDNYYFAKLNSTSFLPDTGNTIFLVTWFEFSNAFLQKNDLQMIYAGVNFVKSISSDISFYNYLSMNILFENNFRFDSSLMQFKYEGGFLLERFSLPLWEVYRLGSFDKLIGYNYDEFQGFYKNFFRIKYEWAILEKLNWELFWFLFNRINTLIIFDVGCAGNDNEVMAINNYHVGIGLGLKFEFLFRKRTPVSITLAIGQAIKQDKYPIFYFVHEF
ncbi:MAG: hypothetical protein N3E50_06185 [Candidatus Goldbacteria bacterium]|nr:hypothetical protein [Candidatus Goldiibacteriota bacterium]